MTSTNQPTPRPSYLKSLRHHRSRLVNRTFTKLDTAAVEDKPFTHALDAFDVGFREILLRPDLDVFFNRALDQKSMQEVQSRLDSLYLQLENIVHPRVLRQSHSSRLRLRPVSSAGRHDPLDLLIEVLDNSDWEFEIATGTAPNLFRLETLHEVNTATDAVNDFNDFFDDLMKIDFGRAFIPDAAALHINDETTVAQHLLPSSLKGLVVLLKELKKPICQNGHHVLLHLPHSRDDTSATPTYDRLSLFISTHENREDKKWLECSFDPCLASQETGLGIESLCQEIEDMMGLTSPEVFQLGTCSDYSLILEQATLYTSSATLSRGCSVTTTLAGLLDHGAFGKEPLVGYEGIQFDERDKRQLAIRLVSNFIGSLESGLLLKCWDPDSIYFISLPEKEDNLLDDDKHLDYPCVLSVLDEDIKTNVLERQKITFPPDSTVEACVFPALAKLLFEIEYGRIRPDIRCHDDVKVDCRNHFGPPPKTRLKDVINAAIQRDLGARSFFHAVTICLEFDRRVKYFERKLRKQRGHAQPEASPSTPTARMLVYNEVLELLGDFLPSMEPSSQDIVASPGTASTTMPINPCHYYGGSPAVDEALSENLPDAPMVDRKGKLQFDELLISF